MNKLILHKEHYKVIGSIEPVVITHYSIYFNGNRIYNDDEIIVEEEIHELRAKNVFDDTFKMFKDISDPEEKGDLIDIDFNKPGLELISTETLDVKYF